MLRAKNLRISHTISRSMSTTVKRSTRKKRRTKWIWTMSNRERRSKSNLQLRLNSSNNNRCRSNASRMTIMTTRTKMYRELTTTRSMPTSRFHKMLRVFSNIFNGTSPKRLTSTPSWDPSSLIMCLQLVRSMLASRCQNQMATRKTSVLLNLMNQPLTAKIKQFWNWNMFKVKMWWERHRSPLIRLKMLTRNQKKYPDGLTACKIYTRRDLLQPWTTRNKCPILTHSCPSWTRKWSKSWKTPRSQELKSTCTHRTMLE